MKPQVSICIPYHDTSTTAIHLARLLHSLSKQTFTDYEIILTKEGKMAENTNASIKRAKGKVIKVMYIDDYFIGEDSLFVMLNALTQSNHLRGNKWLIVGADNNPIPKWTDDLEKGNNKLGSPSALMFYNDNPPLFDEKMSWLLDCDLYKRMDKLWGRPTILEGNYIGIGIHPNQVSNTMSNEEKQAEHNYINKKYDK